MSEKTNKAWMDFLKPVAIGLVGLMAAGASYLQYLQGSKNDKMESRMAAMEVRQDASDKRQDAYEMRFVKVAGDIDNFRVILGDIRSDVAYMRGKMEAKK